MMGNSPSSIAWPPWPTSPSFPTVHSVLYTFEQVAWILPINFTRTCTCIHKLSDEEAVSLWNTKQSTETTNVASVGLTSRQGDWVISLSPCLLQPEARRKLNMDWAPGTRGTYSTLTSPPLRVRKCYIFKTPPQRSQTLDNDPQNWDLPIPYISGSILRKAKSYWDIEKRRHGANHHPVLHQMWKHTDW